jgi:periplasmic divalent cation tolerance protein
VNTSNTSDQALIVLTSLPDLQQAQALARSLVEQRLAACVNVLGGCVSAYRWRGKIETAEEIPLLIKTTAARYAAVEHAIRAQHPYELPEVLAVAVSTGLPAYLAWIAGETAEAAG